MRHPVRSALWFLLTALLVYAALLALMIGLVVANGEGLSCHGDADCGAVSDWLNAAYPYPMLAGIALSILIGVLVAQRQTRS